MIRVLDIQGIIRYFLTSHIQRGDVVIDATAGRGRDTLFLAQCVGAGGRVISFDIQAEAIADTRVLLQGCGLEERVSLHQLDHAKMREIVREEVQAVIFNLGYLPNSDRQVVTKPNSTLLAIREALSLLKVGGVLVLTVYRGHPGAEEEASAVQELLRQLSKKTFSVLEGHYSNQGEKSPYWILVQKNGGD